MSLVGSANRWRSSRSVRVGLAIGLELAARRMATRVTSQAAEGLVDWPRAQRIAQRRLLRAPGRLSPVQLRMATPAYARHMAQVVPLLEARLGSPLPGVVERHAVASRGDWASANIDTFRSLVAHLEPGLMPRARPGSLGAGVAAAANRFLTTSQVGFLLGYLGTRVLGQYDVALLSSEQAPGRLLFVEENIRATARSLGVPLEAFRLWVCLHETTHAFELEAHAWLRPFIRERLERQLALFADETRRLQRDGLRYLARRWRSAAAEGSLRGFLSPEQRALFGEIQSLMSLMEGFSDWVMDEVGAEVLPDVVDIRRRFEARRSQRRRAIDRILARLTGMDLKLEQYRRGERFVAGVHREGGTAAIARLWEGPASLPTDRELDDPVAWIRRVMPESATGDHVTEPTTDGRDPAAIALTPILSARYREEDLARIRAAAPGSRLVSVSLEGLSDSPLDEVEVLLRGPMPAASFDRLLGRCPRLTWVHSATAGVERVLTAEAAGRHLTITNARGVFSEPIAEYTMMMILAVVRRLPELLELQRERTWQPLPARELPQVTIGIVGLGSIGRAVARLATAFGAQVIATRRDSDRRPEAAESMPDGLARIVSHEQLPELLAASDFVVLALPLTPETDKLMDARRLALMKPGAWLINVARGRLIDQGALLRALRNGPLGGAVLDTLWDEPLPASSPLWTAPGLIITPHTSWSSGRVLDRSIALFCDNLQRFRDGRQLLNVIDPRAGY